MAVSIDNVYQQVLTIANKEQRGYITPQEFNLFARKAQLEIFENYFHDLKTAHLKPTSSEDYRDDVDIIKTRLHQHKKQSSLTHVSGNVFTLPSDVYELELIVISPNKLCDEIQLQDYYLSQGNELTKATANSPNYLRSNDNQLTFFPSSSFSSSLVPVALYYKKPDNPNWAYVIVNEKALYNSNLAIDFDLHESEESNLVTRILELSGITLKDQVLSETAMRDQARTNAEKNN
tara:strand:+ start:210 stop:911 length:702 start_codon:yes stop_codon:yes gene_type:complete